MSKKVIATAKEQEYGQYYRICLVEHEKGDFYSLEGLHECVQVKEDAGTRFEHECDIPVHWFVYNTGDLEEIYHELYGLLNP